MKPIIENIHLTAWMEGDIVVNIYKKDLIIGLEIAKEIVRIRKEMTNNKPIKGLIFISNLKAISQEAKEYFASDEATENMKKIALVSDSVSTILIGNAYLKLVPPKIPTKMFTNKDNALKWLNMD